MKESKYTAVKVGRFGRKLAKALKVSKVGKIC